MVTSPDIKSVDELYTYADYLNQAYPKDKDAQINEKNKRIKEDRILSFAEKGAPGGKFRSTRERMLKALNLPKGAKEELNYPPSVIDKVHKNEPLWDDNELDENGEPKVNEEQKYLLSMFAEGKYHLIPAFFRVLIFLKKQKREFGLLFRTFG